MPRKPAPKPPQRLKVSVSVTRGDVALHAECAATAAGDVLRYLAHVVRTVTKEHPDLLPYPDTVPGGAVPYEDDGDVEGRTVGFRH